MTVALWEHILLFMVISLIASLVYNGLRQEDLKTVISLGIKRFAYFMIAGLILGCATFFLAKSL
jgi:hypothetical protein